MNPWKGLYRRRAILFGDGAKGSATQIHGVVEVVDGAEVDTGITDTWKRKDRSDPGTSVVQRGEKTYANVTEAILDYERERDRGVEEGAS